MASHTPRNKNRLGGVSKLSRSAVYRKRALYKKKKVVVKPAEKKAALTKTVEVKGEKNGKTRVVALTKATRYYPTEDQKTPIPRKVKAKAPTTRASITPGTIVILLAGPFRGKRAVVLKTLPSGLILITGPYALNGVPLRRVNQAYVIATSTKVDLTDVKVDAKFNDSYFKRPAAKKAKAGDFFEKKAEEKKAIDPARVADQKAVDGALVKAVAKVPLLKDYLSSTFSLKQGQFPHALKF